MGLSTDTTVSYWTTYNVLAYTKDHKNEDATIVVSAWECMQLFALTLQSQGGKLLE